MSTTLSLRERLFSTLSREWVVAVTGLLLVLYVVFHLAGNLMLLGGPATYNGYAEMLHVLGPGLWVARALLLLLFVGHIYGAIKLARRNRTARAQRYEVFEHAGDKAPATRYMLHTGVVILLFLLLHVYQFAFRAHEGPLATVNGTDLGLYGLAWNTFANPVFAVIYLISIFAVGLHLSHSVSSVLVTTGILRDEWTPKANRFAQVLGGVVAIGFASLPLYVLIKAWFTGGPV